MSQTKKTEICTAGMKSDSGETFRVYPGDPMRDGVRRDGPRVCFTMRVPENRELVLLLYRDDDTTPSRAIPYPASDRIGNVSSVSIYVNPDETWYNYSVDGQIIPDPCAVSVKRATDPVTGEKHLYCAIPSDYTADTDPLYIPEADSVYYKLNVRGFTRGRQAGVRHPGTFTGVEEKIPDMKALGITGVILMPSYEFSDEEKRTETSYVLDHDIHVRKVGKKERKNFWGYSEGLYFAPRAAYCATDDPVREFGHMTDALHENGIECIPEFYFLPGADPRLVTDVLRYWRFVFHVDGFHLVGEGNWIDAVTADPMLVRTKIMYTWFSPKNARSGGSSSSGHLSCMNLGYEHIMRKFLKGDPDVSIAAVTEAMRTDSHDFGKISFFADQDGFTMADMVSYGEKHNEANGDEGLDGTDENYSWNCGAEGKSRKTAVKQLRMHQLRNAFLMLMTGQPSPMIYAGDEVLNSQNGNNNAWCQDNETGWVSWSRSRSAMEMKHFVSECIAFRAAHPVLHQCHPMKMSDYRSCGFPDLSYHSSIAWMSGSAGTKCGFAAMYCGEYAEKPDGSADDTIYIVYNMYWKAQDFALPQLPSGRQWVIRADTSREECFLERGQGIPVQEDKKISVNGRNIVILMAEDRKKQDE